jgi:hypothetical protein
MSKQNIFANELNLRIKLLQEKGADEALLNLLKTSAYLQLMFQPITTILEWIDEQILKMKNTNDGGNNKII